MPAMIPYHASQMYSRNVQTFIQNMVKDGEINLNMEDEIIADTLITRDGEVVNPRVREVLGLATKKEDAAA
jgi:NAD(P) transhydrogenase subunit alpha